MSGKNLPSGDELEGLPDDGASLDPEVVDLGPDLIPAFAEAAGHSQPLVQDAVGVVEPGEDLITGAVADSRQISPTLNPFALTQKELRFAYCYAITGIGAEACKFGGYHGGSSQATKLLQRDDIRSEIQRLTAQLLQVQKPAPPADADEVLARFWEIGNADLTDAYIQNPENGSLRLKPFQAMPLGLRRAIKKINIDKVGVPISIELHDSLASLGKLGSFMGLRMNAPSGPWDMRGIPDLSGGEVPEELDGAVAPAGAPKTKRSWTFEERMRANGDRARRVVLRTG